MWPCHIHTRTYVCTFYHWLTYLRVLDKKIQCIKHVQPKQKIWISIQGSLNSNGTKFQSHLISTDRKVHLISISSFNPRYDLSCFLLFARKVNLYKISCQRYIVIFLTITTQFIAYFSNNNKKIKSKLAISISHFITTLKW